MVWRSTWGKLLNRRIACSTALYFFYLSKLIKFLFHGSRIFSKCIPNQILKASLNCSYDAAVKQGLTSVLWKSLAVVAVWTIAFLFSTQSNPVKTRCWTYVTDNYSLLHSVTVQPLDFIALNIGHEPRSEKY